MILNKLKENIRECVGEVDEIESADTLDDFAKSISNNKGKVQYLKQNIEIMKLDSHCH